MLDAKTLLLGGLQALAHLQWQWKPPPEPHAITLLLHNGGLRAKTRQD